MKFSVLTFGCRSNQADSCRIERDARARGGVPAAPGTADVVVVNTCSVTGAADAAARRAIRGLARANPRARIVVTGCYATRKPDDLGRLPGVVRLLPNDEKPALAAALTAQMENTPGVIPQSLRPGDRGRTALPLDVQTGCDQRCAYCIVPSTRGPSRSRAVAEVTADIRQAAAAGFKELWLTGVHLGSYGRDLRPGLGLLDLLTALDREASSLDVTFRLSSLEPMDCSDEIVEFVASSPRFVPHLHLPLQHASDRVLAAMRRPYTADSFRALLDRVRTRLPDAAIGTDVIAGFPGETDGDFDEQLRLLDVVAPTHLHVFPYSDRPGTEAFGMRPKVPPDVVRRRAERLRGLARRLNRRFIEGQVGLERPALTLGDGSVALTDNYLRVRIAGGRARNERVRVRISSASPLCGEVVA
jgi:threonylcarbamoyladenosine tRNA methylthiotransferase MtaB